MYEIWNIMVQLVFKIVMSFLFPIIVLLFTVAFTDYVILSQVTVTYAHAHAHLPLSLPLSLPFSPSLSH